MPLITLFFFFFFFNDTATTEIYTLSLHDALPIYHVEDGARGVYLGEGVVDGLLGSHIHFQHRDLRRTELFEFLGEFVERSEEHTSELQSPCNLVCRLLLEKKKLSTRI